MSKRFLLLTLLLPIGAGCSGDAEVQLLDPSALTATQQRQQQAAFAARDALFEQMVGRLTAVMSDEGPVKAIEVCRTDAPRLAGEVGEKYGLNIGRTSYKLRNPDNAPHEWARPYVDRGVAEPQFVALPNDRLGALLPIRLKAKCLLCHGPEQDISQDIRTALAEHYPDDQATGFREDDLRGWFWVEVPADVQPPAPAETTSESEDAAEP
jgi:hypothetical protein